MNSRQAVGVRMQRAKEILHSILYAHALEIKRIDGDP